MDYEIGLRYEFAYDARGVLDTIRLTGRMPDPVLEGMAKPRSLFDFMDADKPRPAPRDGLERLFGPGKTEVVLLCGCDQVGTPKLFTLPNGRLVKRVRYDSFGNVLQDTFAELDIPIGFAGGLHDRDTGLVRFGFRDYDPTVGRFTCPDPLGDTGGDHDLYDYCVDDPVSYVDPTGLWEKGVWKEPSVTEYIVPLILLPNGHPYKECIREGTILDIKGRLGGAYGLTQIAVETPGIVGPSSEAKKAFRKEARQAGEDYRDEVERWRKKCAPVFDGSIYKK